LILTGCFDGNIRACSIFPNRFLGVVGGHDGFPIMQLALSADGNVAASISHDQRVKFWNIEEIRKIKLDAQSKSENKKLKNKKLSHNGKSDNFFADLDDNKKEDSDDSDNSDEDENESDRDEEDSDEEDSDDIQEKDDNDDSDNSNESD